MFNLIVIRVANLPKSLAFYEKLGFSFVQEKHENGPIHYSATINGVIFELYQATFNYPVESSLRLGFIIPNINRIINSLHLTSNGIQRIDHLNIIISDPDGRKIHLTELKDCTK